VGIASRAEIVKYPCAVCGAKSGEQCADTKALFGEPENHPIRLFHRERIYEAQSKTPRMAD
jgi:hypothetical protein